MVDGISRFLNIGAGETYPWPKITRSKIPIPVPEVSERMDIAREKAGASGTAQACFLRSGRSAGIKTGRRKHSPRPRCATCGNQLLSKREDMGKLGRWKAGSVMPDRYDRETCTAELRLRNDIINNIIDGWRPQNAHEVPDTQTDTNDQQNGPKPAPRMIQRPNPHPEHPLMPVPKLM